MGHFADPTVGCVSPKLALAGSDRESVVRGVSYRAGGMRRLDRVRASHRRGRVGSILGPTMAAGFFRRETVLAVGGFCPDVGDELADIDMASITFFVIAKIWHNPI